MTTQSVDLFINPTAGRGRAGRRLPQITKLFESRNLSVNVHPSSAVGDLERQILQFASAGGRRLIVAGGDGSIHEAVNGILQSGHDVSFGVIPTGTGNDFAKASSIPLDWKQAAARIIAATACETTPRRIDAGVMNDRFFANGAGVGFDAKVTKIARSYHWPIGDFVYLFAIFRSMLDGIATPEFRILADGAERTGPVTLANISNGAWIGGMFHIAPPARNDDGALDMVVADPVSRWRIVTLLPKLLKGKHLDEPEVAHSRVHEVRIESAVPVPSHLDGEVQPLQSVFDIRVLPGALRLL